PTATLPTSLPARKPKLTTETYDGASDSESSDEEEDRMVEGEEGLGEDEGEDGPALVGGEDGMDMEEEMDEFLKFATETLGLSEEQYKGILGERRERGAFVPPPTKAKKVNVVPTPKPAPTPAPPKTTVPKVPLRNPNLTDFDALMEQMDAELARSRASASQSQPSASASDYASTPSSSTTTAAPKFTPQFKKPTPKPSAKPSFSKSNSSSKPSPVVVSSDSSDSDSEMQEMDTELAELFKTVGGEGGRPRGEGEDGTVDYNLVKNFLESFQSQGGFAGPAGNLSGRLGFTLPRDETQ
ncbi:hypothetical protein P7C70_g5886, partial [Phenoliferia sp. Uapishka_3]